MTPHDSLERLRGLAANVGLTRQNLSALVGDLRVAVEFYTCVPLPRSTLIPVDGPALARSSWCAPLVGAVIGAIAALAYALAWRLNLPPLVAATLAIATGMMVTGCLHEDGLADTADGFGGGGTRDRILEIMHDGRIGAYGTCALAIAIILRIVALADVAEAHEPALVGWALIGAHAAARAGLPMFMRLVPPARPDGLSATAGAPSFGRAATALLIGLVVLAIALGAQAGLIAFALLLAGAAVMAWLARRRIGGQTGDVLGALEQVGECLVLLVTAARF